MRNDTNFSIFHLLSMESVVAALILKWVRVKDDGRFLICGWRPWIYLALDEIFDATFAIHFFIHYDLKFSWREFLGDMLTAFDDCGNPDSAIAREMAEATAFDFIDLMVADLEEVEFPCASAA